MPEQNAMEFYDRVVSDDKRTQEYVLEDASGAELTVDLTVVDRGKVLDEIGKLPDELLNSIDEAEDVDSPEDLDEEEQNMLQNADGDLVDAFENLCAASIEHPEWTQHNVDDVVEELSMEVLFPMGAEIIDFSLENEGSIQGFRKAD